MKIQTHFTFLCGSRPTNHVNWRSCREKRAHTPLGSVYRGRWRLNHPVVDLCASEWRNDFSALYDLACALIPSLPALHPAGALFVSHLAAWPSLLHAHFLSMVFQISAGFSLFTPFFPYWFSTLMPGFRFSNPFFPSWFSIFPLILLDSLFPCYFLSSFCLFSYSALELPLFPHRPFPLPFPFHSSTSLQPRRAEALKDLSRLHREFSLFWFPLVTHDPAESALSLFQAAIAPSFPLRGSRSVNL